MPLRTFRDPNGTEWQVWSVVPGARTSEERRAGFDRRSPDPVLRPPGGDRREHSDRRRPAVALPPQLLEGWLIFEGPGERRRLTPIPPHWDALPEPDLERLRVRALPATRLRGED